MNNPIYLKTYSAPSVSKKEILRYAQCGDSPSIDCKIDALLSEISDGLTFKVCYCRLPISQEGQSMDLSFTKTNSSSLIKNLRCCNEIILFAATIGFNFDRLLAKYSRISPADALLLQAIGTERIEALADIFEKDLKDELKEKRIALRPRFSPGYGDLPLSIQKDVFAQLNPAKNLGITLNDQYIMTPSKSITAIIGLEEIK